MNYYLSIINDNQLPDFPVTIYDIMASGDIFGAKLGSLKGKTTRRLSTSEIVMQVGITLVI